MQSGRKRSAEDEEEDEEGEEGAGGRASGGGARVVRRRTGGGAAGASAGAEADNKPSSLLKTLRPAPPPRPLFLAAPGVANAQSAYFSFSSFLQVGGIILLNPRPQAALHHFDVTLFNR